MILVVVAPIPVGLLSMQKSPAAVLVDLTGSVPSSNLDDGVLTVRRDLARERQGYKLAEPRTPRSRPTLHLPARTIVALRRQQELQETARAALGTAWQDRDGLV